MTGFANVEVGRVSRDGGVLAATITLADGTNPIRATSVPTPCRECYVGISPSRPFSIHFAINTSVNVSLGALLPTPDGRRYGPLRIPIDDVSKLWFQSATLPFDRVINITYRT